MGGGSCLQSILKYKQVIVKNKALLARVILGKWDQPHLSLRGQFWNP